MRRFTRTVALLGVFALGAVLASCDSAEQLAAPQTSAAFAKTSGTAQRLYTSDARSTIIGLSATAEIGKSGGSLTILDNNATVVELVVRGGTVQKPTTFTATITDNFVVELAATSVGSATLNDVGGRGFRKPVYLRLNVKYINCTVPLEQMAIAELTANNRLIPVNSWSERAAEGMFLVGELPHFSGWVPISD